MIVWKYTILTDTGTIITKNPDIAERKSRSGYLVFCKRENNVYKYDHIWFFEFIKVKKGGTLTSPGE